jgi:hypothetical protein
MIHPRSNPDQPQGENANKEVFGDDRRCAVLDIKKLSEHAADSPTVMHGKY